MFQETPYTLPLILSAVLSATVAVYVWRHRSTPGGASLFALMVGASIWAAGEAMQMASVGNEAKMFWTKIVYFGIVIVPTSWLIYTLQYTGRLKRLTPGWAALFVEPVATTLMVWTSRSHSFYWRESAVVDAGTFTVLAVEPGPGFWFHAIYSYALLLAGSAFLIRSLFRSPHLYRRQLAAVVVAVVAPWAANALYIFRISPFPYLDLTPFAFILTGLSIVWGIFRFDLLELVPIARDLMIESMATGILVLDGRSRIVDLNPAARRTLGCEDAALIGHHADAALGNLWSVVESLDPETFQVHEVSIDVSGVTRFYDLRSTPIRDAQGRRTGRIIALYEITDRKETERALLTAKEEAELASRAKSAFLANMSHELRTPMNAIMGMTDLVLESNLPDRERQYLTTAKNSAGHLLDLLDELLDLSRIEAGQLPLEEIAFPIRSTVLEAVSEQVLRAEEKGLRLTHTVAQAVEDRYLGDPTRLRQILVNLIGNAIKFTEDGEVSVRVDVAEGDGGEPANLHFEVRDTGIGIPRERQGQVFDTFVQADVSTTRRYGGSGLGLSISKRLVELMGGRIWVESEEGRGSTFHFTAFLKVDGSRAAKTESESASGPDGASGGLHVLVAEDVEANRELVVALLESFGHTSVCVETGREVLSALERERFDLVLMDVSMPEMSGVEATRIIREREQNTGEHMPILAVTAHAMTGDEERCLEAGMDAYVAKPIGRKRLAEAIQDLTS